MISKGIVSNDYSLFVRAIYTFLYEKQNKGDDAMKKFFSLFKKPITWVVLALVFVLGGFIIWGIKKKLKG